MRCSKDFPSVCTAFSSGKLLINMKKTAFLISLLFIGRVYALGLEEVTLQELSTSGRSLVIDQGNLEKFEEGIFAKFYVSKGPKEFPKIFLVGEGELVKSFPRKSYWLIKQVYIPNAMKANSKVLILRSNEITAGRPLKIKNRHVLISENEYSDVDDYLDKNQNVVPKKLIKEDSNYEPSADIFEKNEMADTTPDSDVVVTTYEKYKKKSSKHFSDDYGELTAQNYFIGNKQVELGDLRRSEDKKLFDSVTDGVEEKTNNMKYGIKSFYREQEREKNLPELASRSEVNSTYDEYKQNQKEKPIIDPRAIAKVKRDGDQWSSDLDDAALRKYFISTGIEKENRRRALALNELEGHEIMLHFANQVTAHGNSTDPNYQGRGYNLGIGYDLHLARTSEDLKNWSLQFVFEKGISNYSLGVFNGRSDETIYGAYLNYYFVHNPLTLNSFIWLAGMGIKNGTAAISTPDLDKNYSYQVLTLPSMQVMTKYRFRSGDLTEDNANIGASLNFAVNLDVKNLSVIDQVEDEINSKISVMDLKYTVGLSVFF